MEKLDPWTPSVVHYAREILDMQSTIRQQAREIEELSEYKKLYFNLLDEGIAHNKVMIKNIVEIAMTPGVLQCMQTENQKKEKINGKVST